MKNKKALSGVVTAMILIGLTIAIGTIVWVMVNGMVKDRLGKAESCYNIYEKIQLNDEYTCYNATSKEVHVSISLKDISPDSVLISIENDYNSTAVVLYKEASTIDNVGNYPSGTGPVSLPGSEAGKTYIITGIEYRPTKISLVPTMSGTSCDVIDSISSIVNCA